MRMCSTVLRAGYERVELVAGVEVSVRIYLYLLKAHGIVCLLLFSLLFHYPFQPTQFLSRHLQCRVGDMAGVNYCTLF